MSAKVHLQKKVMLSINIQLVIQLFRDECSSGGVPECDMIPGCCPQHFNELYGAVSFGDEDGQDNDNN